LEIAEEGEIVADPLDIAKFNLEKVKTLSKIRVDLMKAYADFHFRMAEVVGKQIENAKTFEELQMLRTARKEYELALRSAKKRQRDTEREGIRFEAATRDSERLCWGDMLDPDLVTPAWIGYKFLLAKLDTARRGVLMLKIATKHRLGRHFCRNRFPKTQCPNAPGNIRSAASLFEWARPKGYTPRVDTPPHGLLLQVFDIFNAAAEVELKKIAERLAEARKELCELRQIHWSKIGITNFPPKKEC